MGSLFETHLGGSLIFFLYKKSLVHHLLRVGIYDGQHFHVDADSRFSEFQIYGEQVAVLEECQSILLKFMNWNLK